MSSGPHHPPTVNDIATIARASFASLPVPFAAHLGDVVLRAERLVFQAHEEGGGLSLLLFERVACVRGGRLLFNGLDFALREGEALRLVGPNGAGKSSLLRVAAGLLAPSAGRVRRSASVALADESVALDRERRLGDALCWWAPYDHVELAMAALGLTGLAGVPVRLLSTGQLRRARLARVVASEAPLWLLDEPLNGLDDDGAARLATAIADHRQRGGAVLAASHVALSGEWRTLEIGA